MDNDEKKILNLLKDHGLSLKNLKEAFDFDIKKIIDSQESSGLIETSFKWIKGDGFVETIEITNLGKMHLDAEFCSVCECTPCDCNWGN
tara:strand:+ start:435 stop:701 length:267 start_codon:yes stop_codon:yes gene_type:complete